MDHNSDQIFSPISLSINFNNLRQYWISSMQIRVELGVGKNYRVIKKSRWILWMKINIANITHQKQELTVKNRVHFFCKFQKFQGLLLSFIKNQMMHILSSISVNQLSYGHQVIFFKICIYDFKSIKFYLGILIWYLAFCW